MGQARINALPRLRRSKTGINNLSFNPRCPMRPWTISMMIGNAMRPQRRFSTWQEAIEYRDQVRKDAGLSPIADDDFEALAAFVERLAVDD